MTHLNRAFSALAFVSLALTACGAPAASTAQPPAPTAPATLAPVATATPPVSAATAAPVKSVEGVGEDFGPTVQSVWDTQVGPDALKGCSGGSILPAYGLVQVTPAGNTLIWKNQEPKPYTMTRLKPGVFSYEGPTSLDDGTVKMVATFTSATTLKMTRSFTPKAEGSCVHTHEYRGEFKWEKP